MAAYTRVFLLKCAVQQYAWGKVGVDSQVARLSQSSDQSFRLQPDQPYAELWMGTHPSGLSSVRGDHDQDQSLSSWIQSHPDCLGSKVQAKFGNQLPYLFKVLSVNKALSIQAHPNKSHAEQLHAERPDKYKDANHKPEMAIALTPFEGMCGFRPLEQITGFLKSVAEFKAVVGEEAANSLIEAFESGASDCKPALQRCFTGMMNCPDQTVAHNLASLVSRIQGNDLKCDNSALLLRLHSQFPGDVGCFSTFFLNHVTLQPGESMFLGPNEIHAYIDGNCMECMACSDNVVRAGLTPKYKDVPTLCQMLTYQSRPPAQAVFQSVADPADPFVTLYDPPVPDFAVARIKVPADIRDYTLKALDSAGIAIVISGRATATVRDGADQSPISLGPGSVAFVSANQSLSLECHPGGLLMFRAYCPL